MSAGRFEQLIRTISYALLSKAVRGRDEHGGPWGEAMLREFSETRGAREAVRWMGSGLRVALRERRGRAQPARRQPPGAVRQAIRAIAAVLVALVVGTLVNRFVIGSVFVASSAMEPSLRVSDRVLIDRVGFRLSDLDHGDVVLFRSPGHASTMSLDRVVGLAGDRLSCQGGRLHRNGAPADEPYLLAATETDCASVTVPDGAVYVMGDDRAIARDSRTYGPISAGDVTGRFVTRYWPVL
jgi:signal peptidase I